MKILDNINRNINKIATINKAEISEKSDYARNIKHYVPAGKEWSNSVYLYNKNTKKPFISFDKTISKLIKSYFNSYSRKLEEKVKKTRSRWLRVKEAKLSVNRILVSKAELKHTNDKVLVTVYIFNSENKYYLNKIKKIFTIYQMDKLISKAWTFNEKYSFIFSKINKHIKQKWTVKDISNFSYNKLNKNLISNFIHENKSIDKIYTFFINVFNKGSHLLEFPNKIRIDPKNSEPELKVKRSIGKALVNRKTFLNCLKPKTYFKLLNQTDIKVMDLKSKLENYKKTFYLLNKKLNLTDTPHIFLNEKFSNNKLNMYEFKYLEEFSEKHLRRELIYTYFKQLIRFNNIKFDKNFITILGKEIKKLYLKNVEFNIVNLKYPYLDSSIFSTTLVAKVRNKKNYYMNILNKSLLMFSMQGIGEKDRQNIYNEMYRKKTIIQNLNINNIFSDSYLKNTQYFPINKHNIMNPSEGVDILDKSLLSMDNLKSKKTTDVSYTDEYNSKSDVKSYTDKLTKVVKTVKNKSLNGVRIELAGRLSKYNTASRSIFKLKYKGNIKNIDSSDKGLSVVMLRGNSKSNLQYSKSNSKVRIGSFGLKGWISSK